MDYLVFILIFSINHFSFSPCVSTYIIITHWLIINKFIKQQVIVNVLQNCLIRVLLYKEFYLNPLCFISLQYINQSTIAYNWITDGKLSLNMIKSILIVKLNTFVELIIVSWVMSPLFSNRFIVALVVPPRKIVFGFRRIGSSVKSISATYVMFFRKEGLTILLAIFSSKRYSDNFNMWNIGSSRWSSKLKFVKIEIVAWVNKNAGSSKGSLNYSFNL